MQDIMDMTKYPDANHCTLGINSWEELVTMRKSGNYTVASGSLGHKTMPGVYDTWMCIKGYKPWLERCAEDLDVSPDEHFCFAFLDAGDHMHGIFVPWGTNKDLKLVKSKCGGV